MPSGRLVTSRRLATLALFACWLNACWPVAFCQAASSADRPNILFIAVDDLRPELGCYGKQHIHSPNIDQLAQSGVVFERAFCMVPTCGASRASLMTGLRPTRDRFVTYTANAQRETPQITTLNTHFKNYGYYTVSNGKVFHHAQDNARGWSEPPMRPSGPGYQLAASLKTARQASRDNAKKRGPPIESADVPDGRYRDGILAEKTIQDLRRLRAKEQPFFLAVGFYKPHLPFVAPKKYWDLYDPEDITLPDNYHIPEDAPAESIHNSGELRAYAGVPAKGRLPDELARQLIHGYYACVSFTDSQIGRILAELDTLGLRDTTIVVLWGDHGWNLGEHTLWCKHSCFETSMHAPLIIRAPGVAKSGARVRGLTEFIDIYPSLCELAALPSPQHLQGTSFVRLLKQPDLAGKPAAVGRFRDGDTIRTDHHRFTEYTRPGGVLRARMLYDHRIDPGENVNIADEVEHASIIRRLHQQLQDEQLQSPSIRHPPE